MHIAVLIHEVTQNTEDRRLTHSRAELVGVAEHDVGHGEETQPIQKPEAVSFVFRCQNSRKCSPQRKRQIDLLETLCEKQTKIK